MGDDAIPTSAREGEGEDYYIRLLFENVLQGAYDTFSISGGRECDFHSAVFSTLPQISQQDLSALSSDQLAAWGLWLRTVSAKLRTVCLAVHHYSTPNMRRV